MTGASFALGVAVMLSLVIPSCLAATTRSDLDSSNAGIAGTAATVVAEMKIAEAQARDPRIADFLHTGKIRVALFLPLYAKDPTTGELQGNLDGVFLVEIIRALAARLSIDVQLVGYPTPAEAVEAIKSGMCDVGFFGTDPVRAAEVDFSPPLVQEDYTYLVPAGSSIHSIADSDRPGIRIAVVRNHASTVALSKILKEAELVYGETPDPTVDLLRTGRADAMASARPGLLAYSNRVPGSRVLDDGYGALFLAIAVRKGQVGRLSYISEFVAEAKRSGMIKSALEHAGARGVEVVP